MSDYFYSLESIRARAGYFELAGLFGIQDGGDGLFPSLANEDNQ